MTTLEITVGAHEDYPLQCWNRGALTAPVFLPTDTLTAYVYRGQDQVSLFAPTVTWYTAGNTQTGYDQGQVLLTITSAQSATLEASGTYTIVIWRTPTASVETSDIWRGQLTVRPAAGTDTQAITPYCTYEDMLAIAPWVKLIQDSDTDQEGFYSQRLEARQMMDWSILNNYRGAYVGLFEQMSTLAFEFGYAGWRRSLGPSPSLLTYLEQNKLILRPQIIRCCARWAIWLVAQAQVATNNLYVGYGMFQRDTCISEMCATTAEVDLNGDGIGELFINLGSTNTLFT